MGNIKSEDEPKYEKAVDSKGDFMLVKKELPPPNLDIKDFNINANPITNKKRKFELPKFLKPKNITPVVNKDTKKIVKCKLTFSLLVAMLLEFSLLFVLLAIGMFIGWLHVLPLLIATVNTLAIQTLRVV